MTRKGIAWGIVLWAALVALTLVLLPADARALEIEGGTIAALNSDCDLGLAVSIGTELPEWLPLLGGHLGFGDLLTVNTQQAIGLSVSIRKADEDDGWRIGATVTQPVEGAREVLGYLRFGVTLW